jgi:hypothetical protein
MFGQALLSLILGLPTQATSVTAAPMSNEIKILFEEYFHLQTRKSLPLW